MGALRQLTDTKAAIQAELKDLQGKIEAAQKDLQPCYHDVQSGAGERQAAEEANVDPDELTPENLMAIMASVGVQATQSQIQDFASKLVENVAKRRKCG